MFIDDEDKKRWHMEGFIAMDENFHKKKMIDHDVSKIYLNKIFKI